MRLNCPQGLTIKELKDFLKDLPETDSAGLPHEVWLDVPLPYIEKRTSIFKNRNFLEFGDV